MKKIINILLFHLQQRIQFYPNSNLSNYMLSLKFHKGINPRGMYLPSFHFCVNSLNFISVMSSKGVNELWICTTAMHNNKRADKLFIFDAGGVALWFLPRAGQEEL